MSAMKHYLCRTILYLLIFTVLILTPDAESDSDCSTEIRVRRNTVYNASAGQQLWINCPVFFCNDSPTTVTWYKVEEAIVPVDVSGDSHIKTELKPLNKSVWIFYLIFQNILRHDSGQYQCQGGGSMGHAITVNVYDHAEITTITQNNLTDHGEITTVTQNNLTVSTTSVPDNTETLLLYVYSAAGITTFVIIVIIISVISMRGCKGKPKKDSQVENQQMEIPMVDQFFSKVIFKHLERGKRKTLCSAISEM
ncbi:B- and T-lymphocyte attenuator-like isoform X1 [Astatotilapia calliptera]|uniref:B- and T-lymphocyte attenuator-like isoform X1 n=1 Tax=Astatotilapia calliptera TaxID=8154 RepID=UPI000E403E56|nr:B- and T-lymphocyte attenuator-like isoform X1 [Astatotilapia calliptera]